MCISHKIYCSKSVFKRGPLISNFEQRNLCDVWERFHSQKSCIDTFVSSSSCHLICWWSTSVIKNQTPPHSSFLAISSIYSWILTAIPTRFIKLWKFFSFFFCVAWQTNGELEWTKSKTSPHHWPRRQKRLFLQTHELESAIRCPVSLWSNDMLLCSSNLCYEYVSLVCVDVCSYPYPHLCESQPVSRI